MLTREELANLFKPRERKFTLSKKQNPHVSYEKGPRTDYTYEPEKVEDLVHSPFEETYKYFPYNLGGMGLQATIDNINNKWQDHNKRALAASRAYAKHFEGKRLDAYMDKSDHPTIGYGSTFYEDNTPVRMGDTISDKQSDNLLLWDIDQNRLKRIRNAFGNQKYYDMPPELIATLMQFHRNTGHLFDSTLFARLKNGEDYRTVLAQELPRWQYITKNKVKTPDHGVLNSRLKLLYLLGIKPDLSHLSKQGLIDYNNSYKYLNDHNLLPSQQYEYVRKTQGNK